MLVGLIARASSFKDESAYCLRRDWNERIVRVVREDEANAIRMNRVVGPFKRARKESMRKEGVGLV